MRLKNLHACARVNFEKESDMTTITAKRGMTKRPDTKSAGDGLLRTRAIPNLTAGQVALHSGITKSGKAFSLENAVKLYANRKQSVA